MTSRTTLGVPRTGRTSAPPSTQRGLVVFVALIVLVAMTLAGLAVMRSSGTAILTAGNLAFKQGTVVSGDAGIEQAITNYLRVVGPVTLQNDSPGNGYYATWVLPSAPNTAFDPITWTGWSDPSQRAAAGVDSAGNTVTYVIHRMCLNPGVVDENNCVVLKGGHEKSSKSAVDYAKTPISGETKAWYRITARIEGPKNTLSYVQSMVN